MFYLFVVGPPIIVEHLQKASYLVPKEKFTVCTADLALLLVILRFWIIKYLYIYVYHYYLLFGNKKMSHLLKYIVMNIQLVNLQ